MTVTSPFLPPKTSSADSRWWDDVELSVGDRHIDVFLVSDGEALVGVSFGPLHPGPNAPAEWKRDSKAVAEAAEQLHAYAAGDLTEFQLPMRPRGTEFQLQVWSTLHVIPFGTTTTYGYVAKEIGRPTGSRAVGAAVGANPLGIVIPCHRVIGADGSLTGYAGGMDNKTALLRLEGVTALS